MDIFLRRFASTAGMACGLCLAAAGVAHAGDAEPPSPAGDGALATVETAALPLDAPGHDRSGTLAEPTRLPVDSAGLTAAQIPRDSAAASTPATPGAKRGGMDADLLGARPLGGGAGGGMAADVAPNPDDHASTGAVPACDRPGSSTQRDSFTTAGPHSRNLDAIDAFDLDRTVVETSPSRVAAKR